MNLAMTGTFSKSPLAWGLPADVTVIKAQGQHVRLSNGQYYLDWVNGLGTNLYGYGYFSDLIAAELANGGGSHTLPHSLEHKAAKFLVAMLSANIPHWNDADLQVRFGLSGTDSVNTAVRLARAVTGRDAVLVLKGGYHGWADWTIARTKPAAGIPRGYKESVIEFEFNNIPSLFDAEIKAKYSVAAVVIEQGIVDPAPGFYDEIRKYCNVTGSLFIMDEVVTGLRYGLGGACQKYNIKPDIVCMGKGLGNGLPVSAVVARSELMGEFAKVSPVFCSSTHWGNSVNMAAATAVLKSWSQDKVNYLESIGALLMDSLLAVGWNVIGHPARSLLTFGSLEEQAFFIQGMFEEGILMNRPNFPTLVITEKDVDQTFEAATRIRAKYKTALERGTLADQVKGKLPRVLFSDR